MECRGKTIVVSGINLFQAGPLSIYKDFLSALEKNKIIDNNRVIIFVHKKELFLEYKDKAEIIELPRSRKNYFYRCYYEWFYFKRYSLKENIDYWISLHDITPRVKSDRLYTYCHNPSPFYRLKGRDLRFNKKFSAFVLGYGFLYRINIKKNDYIIVQQDWIRGQFNKWGIKNIIVARPNVTEKKAVRYTAAKENEKYTFIYAAYPRTFKNYETICEACRSLDRDLPYKVQFTIDGSENSYSNYIYRKYKDTPNIEWIGIQTRDKLFELYSRSDCMIFASELETWGLPISEYKSYGKPVILADLPYAHETVGNYEKTAFFEVNNSKMLAGLMEAAVMGKMIFSEHKQITPDSPYAENWDELCGLLFGEGLK